MHTAFLFTMSVLATATAIDFCNIVTANGTLPSICTCTNAGGGFDLQCDLTHTFSPGAVSFDVTNKNKLEFEPCASGGFKASVSSAGKIGTTPYTLAKKQLGQGAATYIAIPGATLGTGTFPTSLGGLYLKATLSGTLAALEIDLALTACIGTASSTECDVTSATLTDCCLTPVPVIDTTFPTLEGACATPAPTPGGGGNSTSTGSKSNAGAIAGGVIGGLAGVGLIAGGVIFMRRRQANSDFSGTEVTQLGTAGK